MGRDVEALKRKRANQKARRQLKSDLTSEHLEFMRDLLEEHNGSDNLFAKVARDVKGKFNLECSIDWLRGKVQSKYEEWTGLGAKRRKQPTKDLDKETVDLDVVQAFEVLDRVAEVSKKEKEWQKEVVRVSFNAC